MEVKKLQESISKYKRYLQKDREFSNRYIWEALANFQTHWDIDSPDFSAMYDQSFQSDYSRRLWKREAWHPKEMMVKMAKLDPEFVRRMFKDLADEGKELEGRISRFKFGCDTLLSDYKSKKAVSIENNHFHDDSEMIFLYLTYLFPEKYTLFQYNAFRKVNEILATPILPGPYDLGRFVKITNIFNTFLRKEDDLLALNDRRLGDKLIQLSSSRILVFDFYDQLAKGFVSKVSLA